MSEFNQCSHARPSTKVYLHYIRRHLHNLWYRQNVISDCVNSITSGIQIQKWNPIWMDTMYQPLQPMQQTTTNVCFASHHATLSLTTSMGAATTELLCILALLDCASRAHGMEQQVRRPSVCGAIISEPIAGIFFNLVVGCLGTHTWGPFYFLFSRMCVFRFFFRFVVPFLLT